MSQEYKIIDTTSSLDSFFFDQLHLLNQKQTGPLDTSLIYYSAQVLTEFTPSTQAFETTEEGKIQEKILGEKYLRASQLSKAGQKRTYKEIGDTCLFFCGLFSEAFNKKLIDGSYYFSLGKSSYNKLNTLLPNFIQGKNFFLHLSDSFESLVYLLNIFASNLQSVSKDQQEWPLLILGSKNQLKAG